MRSDPTTQIASFQQQREALDLVLQSIHRVEDLNDIQNILASISEKEKNAKKNSLPLELTDEENRYFILKIFVESLWTISVLQNGPLVLAFKIFQSLCFIGQNIGVNWYSTSFWRERLWPWLFFTLNSVYGASTAANNGLSKINDIGSEADGLKVARENPNINAFKKFLRYLFPNAAETYYEVLWQKVSLLTLHRHAKHILCIDENDVKYLGGGRGGEEKLYLILIALGIKYRNTTGNTLPMVTYENLSAMRIALETKIDTDYQAPHKNSKLNKIIREIVILSTYENMMPATIANHFSIIAYPTKTWKERTLADFKKSPLSGIKTASLAFGSLIRWFITMGFPTWVIICTGIHALGNLEGIDKIDSRLLAGVLFSINAFVSAVGKGYLTGKQKGNQTTQTILEFLHYLVHHSHLAFPQVNWKAFSVATVINLAVYVYYAATAWFYVAAGMNDTVRQFSYIFGFDISLPKSALNSITFAAVVTSLFTTLATNHLPNYFMLSRGKTSNSASKLAIEAHKLVWYVFMIGTFIDSVGFGNNAFFNIFNTCINNNLINNTTIIFILALFIGICVAISALYWSQFKAEGDFPKFIGAAERAYSDIKSLFSKSESFTDEEAEAGTLLEPLLTHTQHEHPHIPSEFGVMYVPPSQGDLETGSVIPSSASQPILIPIGVRDHAAASHEIPHIPIATQRLAQTTALATSHSLFPISRRKAAHTAPIRKFIPDEEDTFHYQFNQ